MAEQNERSAFVPADPASVFDAWLDGAGHAAMTGSAASSTPEIGGEFTAWDGYIEGTWSVLERPSRIVMNWSTQAFPAGSEASQVEVRIDPTDGGSTVTIRHTNIPDGQGADYHQGWHDHYFAPMNAHFGD